ncbi:hypothetical protein KXQ82_00990 [Mucilaginibacter sp. HMF5004]|uniref:hypothetical protein n=1 Tax=Mucilaginibacter rivuli TaxID=2857527 RepID=UPI001C5E82B2|nr:hypothetical protein [Mucilaginibacter rivuli]MBW4888264.1 hypothetical protein [Mucilaginibacter rivuli]
MAKKTPKVTRLINGLIENDYFKTNRSLADITNAIVEQSGEVFYTNQVSGIILVMVRQGKLIRSKDETTKMYAYRNP